MSTLNIDTLHLRTPDPQHRQMMQHLHRLHHVTGWLEEQGVAGPLPLHLVLERVEQLRSEGREVVGRIRAIPNPARWAAARRARLRLSKAQLDSIFAEAGGGLDALEDQVRLKVSDVVTVIDNSEPLKKEASPMNMLRGDQEDLGRLKVSGVVTVPDDTVAEGPSEPLKKETGPKDVLRGDQEEIVAIVQNKSSEAISMEKYEFNVRKRVINVLKKYYASNAEDLVDKKGNKKVIKIKSKEEFEKTAKHFTKKYQKEIMESYLTFNMSTEGIDKINIGEYNIDHEIEKYFSSI